MANDMPLQAPLKECGSHLASSSHATCKPYHGWWYTPLQALSWAVIQAPLMGNELYKQWPPECTISSPSYHKVLLIPPVPGTR